MGDFILVAFFGALMLVAVLAMNGAAKKQKAQLAECQKTELRVQTRSGVSYVYDCSNKLIVKGR